MNKSTEELTFMEWLQTLNDDDLHCVVEMLCAAAAELRVTRGKVIAFSADDLLKLDPHVSAKLFVN